MGSRSMERKKTMRRMIINNYWMRLSMISFSISISILLVKEENTMIILRNPQIAELIEAGCAFRSNVIISKNEQRNRK